MRKCYLCVYVRHVLFRDQRVQDGHRYRQWNVAQADVHRPSAFLQMRVHIPGNARFCFCNVFCFLNGKVLVMMCCFLSERELFNFPTPCSRKCMTRKCPDSILDKNRLGVERTWALEKNSMRQRSATEKSSSRHATVTANELWCSFLTERSSSKHAKVSVNEQ